MNKRALGIIVASAFAIAAFGAPAAAAPAVVRNECPNVDCQDFLFWDGNGAFVNVLVDQYHDVMRGNGSETETFKGTVANDTGNAVIYSPVSGSPIPADQLCGSFASGRTTSDWQMTISASGNYSLVCLFPAA